MKFRIKKFRLWRQRRDGIRMILWLISRGLRRAHEFEFTDSYGKWVADDGPLWEGPKMRAHTITIIFDGGAKL